MTKNPSSRAAGEDRTVNSTEDGRTVAREVEQKVTEIGFHGVPRASPRNSDGVSPVVPRNARQRWA